MLTFGRQHRNGKRPATLSPEMGATLAANVRELITSGGCLMGNLAGLGEQVAHRLAEGGFTDDEARALNERIGLLIQSIEPVCAERVSPLREGLPKLTNRPDHPHQH